MRDALLLVDVLNDFRHDDGNRLAASFRRSHPQLCDVLASAREAALPVIYANDHAGDWTADRHAVVRRARAGVCGDLMPVIAPRDDEIFLIKPGYSAFDDTPLRLVLADLDVERVLLAGTALEMCVVQTAIAARERQLKVSIMVDACACISAENADVALAYVSRVAGARLSNDAAHAGSNGRGRGT
jgi:nicotinamidase-related amidase